MATYDLQVDLIGSSVQFSIASSSSESTDPAGVLTLSNLGTQLNVQGNVAINFTYAGTLNGIKIAESPAALSTAPVRGGAIGPRENVESSRNVTVFSVERTQPDTIQITDTGAEGMWYFQLGLDGTWPDPQIYNKGSEPPT